MPRAGSPVVTPSGLSDHGGKEEDLTVSEYTLRPQGEIDVATVEAQRGQWLATVDERRPRRLVIDMSDVTFLDSTGLGAIVALQRRQRAHGGVVAIANAAPAVERLLQLTGMHLTMEVNGVTPADPG
jgi:anti-sigma B factor antagonist